MIASLCHVLWQVCIDQSLLGVAYVDLLAHLLPVRSLRALVSTFIVYLDALLSDCQWARLDAALWRGVHADLHDLADRSLLLLSTLPQLRLLVVLLLVLLQSIQLHL